MYKPILLLGAFMLPIVNAHAQDPRNPYNIHNDPYGVNSIGWEVRNNGNCGLFGANDVLCASDDIQKQMPSNINQANEMWEIQKMLIDQCNRGNRSACRKKNSP